MKLSEQEISILQKHLINVQLLAHGTDLFSKIPIKLEQTRENTFGGRQTLPKNVGVGHFGYGIHTCVCSGLKHLNPKYAIGCKDFGR